MTKRLNDLTGQKFGDLVVLGFVKFNNQNRAIWTCCCNACGKEKDIRADALTSGATETCGCRGKDLTNRRFGRLIVIEQVESSKSKRRVWSCQCDCGNFIETASNNLLSGDTTSCGCLALSGDMRVKHGHSRLLKKTTRDRVPGFGKRSKVYIAWCNMKHRCYSESYICYDQYGGRGITVCERWQNSFENFLVDMGEPADPRLSLERLDVNGHYEPDNVVWASQFVQSMNKQETQAEYQDLKDTLKHFCEMTGVDYVELITRLHAGEPMLPLLKNK